MSGDFKCGLLLSKGPSSMPTKMKTRKRAFSSDIPPEEDPEDIDISDKGPIRNFRELVDLSKWVRDIMKKGTKSKRKRPKKSKVTPVTKLGDIYEKLEELDKLIGLEDLKDQIAMQIVFFIQDLNKDEMMHTAIMGPPGMCKTTVTEILAKIYSKLGFLSSGHVVSATRSDLVGQFLGETSIKTRDVLENAEGGVLLLDEAYQLGDPRGRDSFAAECINTINQYLSENSSDFMCIVAGYKEKMYQNFFSANPGLDRRFTWKFTLKPYTVADLEKIFEYQINKYGWTYDKENISIRKYIEKNKDNFKNNGGDTLVFFDKCKMAHSQRIFTASKGATKKYLTAEDVEKGFKSFNLLKDEGKESNKDEIWSRMYM